MSTDVYPRQVSGRILVGYVATKYGKDALNLAITMARGRKVALEIAMVMPDAQLVGVYPHDRGYSSIIEEQIAQWLEEALSMVPDDIEAIARIVPGESIAEALNAAAVEHDCDAIVVGAREGGIFNRFRIGSIATALLHSATVPVALAPRGFESSEPVQKVTSLFGPRPGAQQNVAIALDRAVRRGVPLRLISLNIGKAESAEEHKENCRDALRKHSTPEMLAALEKLKAEGKLELDTAVGATVEQALRNFSWAKGEVAVMGSARIALKGSLFLGGTASKILRSIPVPTVIVPRDYQAEKAEVAGAEQ